MWGFPLAIDVAPPDGAHPLLTPNGALSPGRGDRLSPRPQPRPAAASDEGDADGVGAAASSTRLAWAGNGRRQSARQIRQIANSIAAFGFNAQQLLWRRPTGRLGRAGRPGREAALEPGKRRLLHGNVEAMRSGIELAPIGLGRIGPGVRRRKA